MGAMNKKFLKMSGADNLVRRNKRIGSVIKQAAEQAVERQRASSQVMYRSSLTGVDGLGAAYEASEGGGAAAADAFARWPNASMLRTVQQPTEPPRISEGSEKDSARATSQRPDDRANVTPEARDVSAIGLPSTTSAVAGSNTEAAGSSASPGVQRPDQAADDETSRSLLGALSDATRQSLQALTRAIGGEVEPSNQPRTAVER